MKKILIIEDNQDTRENTADILKLSSYQVFTAENGEVGIESVRRNKPDIIICDIMMPGLNGYEVLEQLGKDRTIAGIPFIFLTAKTGRTDIRKGMALGADDYLTKPFEEKELLEAVATRLKKYSFLKKEFSNDVEGINQFFDEVSSHKGMERLSQDKTTEICKKKEILFMEGKTAHSLYFVQSGTLKTYKTTEYGKCLVTGMYGSGQFVGQLSLLTEKGKYIDTASVLDEATVIKIPKEDFKTLLYGNKLISNKFISMISNDLIALQNQLVQMAFATVKQRLAQVLLKLYKNETLNANKTEGIQISREDLAGLLGTATETAIRMLTDFKVEGLVKIDSHRRIHILDEEELEEVANFG
jgi:DNA-binding response OmpR family regulator